jgi:DNA polymerase-1
MSTRPPRLYLVDGSSYIYRAFFALPPLSSPSGLPTNAVYGFTTMLLKLLSEAKPQYMAVVFDAPGTTFRDEMFDAYKANRVAMPDDLTSQVPFIHEVVRAFRLHTLIVPSVEADDVIATLVTRLTADGIGCVVVTADKDLMQLVGPEVRLWDTMRDRWVDAAAVEARLGVSPSQVVDVIALMGDAVDNIPGVKGIGEKTAAALIRHFGSLEAVLDRLDEVESLNLRGAKRIASLLWENREMARLSRDLARARRDVPLSCTLEDLKTAEPDRDALRTLFSQLGFHSLLRQLTDSAPPIDVEASIARSAEEVSARFDRARAAGWVSLATIAEPRAGPTAPAREVVLSIAEGAPLRVGLDDEELKAAFHRGLTDRPPELVAHDLKRDLLRLTAAGISAPGRAFDVMIASYLSEASPTHALEELAANLLGARLPPFRADAEGATAGVSVLGPLAANLRRRLRECGLESLFADVEMPLVRVLAGMERRGMLLDVAHLRAMSEDLAARLRAIMNEIYALAGGEFNLNSPPQLRTVLFEKLGLSRKGVRRGKTGYSTDVDVLTRLAREHPLPEKILQYRMLAKLKSTYVDALPAAVDPQTGRLHTSFNQTVAATGRLSSSEPNLQNIPIRGEEGRRIRQAFVAPRGHVLIAADYSQIELRVLAHLSRDPALIEAFRSGQDIHARTAAEVFGVTPGTITPEMRRAAKVINFGILYGMGPQRLAQELGIPVADAQRYIASYFERYAGVRAYMDGVVASARKSGFVTTILGRRRAVPELRSSERGVAQAAERVATNTPIQGSAADLIKLAMVAVERRLAAMGLRAVMILQVHDELLLEAPESEQDIACEAVRGEMEDVMSLHVPLRVDLGVGHTWAEAH